MAAVKFAPFLNMERARATAAYEQEEEAAPKPQAFTIVPARSSGSRFDISSFETTACTTADKPNPRIKAQRISHAMIQPFEAHSQSHETWFTSSFRALKMMSG